MSRSSRSRDPRALKAGAVPEPSSLPDMQLAAMNLPVLRADDALGRLDALAHPMRVDAPPPWTPGALPVPGQQYLVALEWLRDNPNNARAVYSERDIKALAESLRTQGQLQPVQAYVADSSMSHLVLREGHTRVRAARLARLRHLRVELVEAAQDGFSEYRASRELNVRRNNVTVFDDAVRLGEWLASGARRQSELCTELGLSEDYVSKALKVGRLPRLLLERMALSTEPAIGVAAAYLVAQFHERFGLARTDRLISRVIEERLSVRQLEQLVRHGENPAQPSASRRLRPLSRLELSGGGRGELKAFGDGRIELSLRELDDERRNALFSRLAKAMAEEGVEVRGVIPSSG